MGGGIALMLGTRVQIPVVAWLRFKSWWGLYSGQTNVCMRGEEISSCKNHIAPVSLTDWCMIFFKQINKKRRILQHKNKNKIVFYPSEITFIMIALGYYIHSSDSWNIHTKNNSFDLLLQINHLLVLVIIDLTYICMLRR